MGSSFVADTNQFLLAVTAISCNLSEKAGIANKPDDYPWSSHKGYLSVAKKWKWLHKEFIFSMLTKNREEWVKEYRRFVAIENDEEIAGVLERKKWPSFLGSERFIDWVKGKYRALKADQEVPQAKELAPEADSIITAVCKIYNVCRDELYRSRRGQYNEPRNVAIFLTRKLRRDSLEEIAHQFQMKKYSSISSVIERMKKQILADRNLKKRVDKMADRAGKSQEQT
jgi:hypothetical protein